MERKWKLGEDLLESDNIFDPITFESIVLYLKCNEPKHNKEAVIRCFEDILEQCLEDARFLLENNVGEIIQYAKD